MLETEVKITWQDLYDYNLRHAYSNPAGLIGAVWGAIGLVYGAIGFANGKGSYSIMLMVIGALLLLYMPFTLFVKAKQAAALNPEFKKPLHYVLDETGLTISQGDASSHMDWDGMHKAVSTPRSIILYTSKVNATIFPKKQLGEQTALLVQVISANMPPKKVKIRS